MLMTETVGYQDNPTHSILRGHVDLETFNKAYLAEWDDSDGFDQDLVSHEYWVYKNGSWTKSEKENPKAETVTVGVW